MYVLYMSVCLSVIQPADAEFWRRDYQRLTDELHLIRVLSELEDSNDTQDSQYPYDKKGRFEFLKLVRRRSVSQSVSQSVIQPVRLFV